MECQQEIFTGAKMLILLSVILALIVYIALTLNDGLKEIIKKLEELK